MPAIPFRKQTYQDFRSVDLGFYKVDRSFDTKSPIDVLSKELIDLIWKGAEFHPRSLSPGYSHEEFLERCMLYSDPPVIPPDDEVPDDKKGSLVVMYKYSMPLRQTLFYGTPDCVEVKFASGMDYTHSNPSDHALITYSWSIVNRQEAMTGLRDKVFHPMLDPYYGLSLLAGVPIKLRQIAFVRGRMNHVAATPRKRGK